MLMREGWRMFRATLAEDVPTQTMPPLEQLHLAYIAGFISGLITNGGTSLEDAEVAGHAVLEDAADAP